MTNADNERQRDRAASLRRRVLALRDSLDGGEAERGSAAIRARLQELDVLRSASCVMAFAHFRGEVRTREILQDILDAGKTLCLPWTDTAARRIPPVRIVDPAADLAPGYQGIPEPRPELRVPRAVDPAEIDLVLVPGSVFDAWGNRMGYGGGYYDRFLADEAPRALRVGLCFEMQVRGQPLPVAPHDQRMDLLVTEERILRFNRDPSPAERPQRST